MNFVRVFILVVLFGLFVVFATKDMLHCHGWRREGWCSGAFSLGCSDKVPTATGMASENDRGRVAIGEFLSQNHVGGRRAWGGGLVGQLLFMGVVRSGFRSVLVWRLKRKFG
jgi:hypothetical protein